MTQKRMRSSFRMVLVLSGAGLVASACATAPVVPVRGTATDLAALAGEWHGTYSSRATGRSGSVSFKFTEGENHGHGYVLMTGDGRAEASYGYGPGRNPQGQNPESQSFRAIQFVGGLGSTVEGTLDPYWDPACRCEAATTFRGHLAGDRLRGTFTTRFGEDAIATGRWEATRKPLRTH